MIRTNSHCEQSGQQQGVSASRGREKCSFERAGTSRWSGFTKYIGIAATLLTVAVHPAVANAAMEQVHDFESGKLDSLWCHGNCPTVTKQIPARTGKYSMRSSLSESSSNIKRTEGIFKNPTGRRMTWNKDYWIGFSVYMPANWKHYNKFEIVAQIHATKDPGESQQQPPFAIYTGSGDWKLTNRWGTGGSKKEWSLNSVYEDVGRWTDFVIHYKPSYTSSGVLRVWKNGALVAQRNGANAYKDKAGPYFTLGLYTGLFAATDGRPAKVVYHDALRVASGSSARYQDVAPPGTPGSGSGSIVTPPEAPESGDSSNDNGDTSTDRDGLDLVNLFDGSGLQMACHGNCPTLSSQFSRSGSKSMKSTVSTSSNNKKRTQAVVSNKSTRQMVFDRDYWMGFSVYLPKGWQVPGKREIVAEIRRTPDAGERSSSAFEILTGDGDWTLRNNWGSGDRKWSLNSVYESVGRWTDFVIHYRPSYKSTGILEVWKNGTLVARRTGPNIERDAKGPYLALGLLKDYTSPSSQTVYHDSLRIASGSSARYSDVAP